jgi:hypothetical protein
MELAQNCVKWRLLATNVKNLRDLLSDSGRMEHILLKGIYIWLQKQAIIKTITIYQSCKNVLIPADVFNIYLSIGYLIGHLSF